MDDQKQTPTLETAVDLESKGEYISAAQMFKELGMLEKAIECSLKPQGFNSPQFKFAAETALELGDTERVRKICEEGMRYIEKECERCHDMGAIGKAADLALLLKDYDRAIRYWEKYDGKTPYLRCARISKESGNTERTKRFYDLALKGAIDDYNERKSNKFLDLGLVEAYHVFKIAEEFGDADTANEFYNIIVDICGKTTPTEFVAEIAEKKKDFKRAIEYYKKSGCLGNAARVAHISDDIREMSSLFGMILDKLVDYKTNVSPSGDVTHHYSSQRIYNSEMVEAGETYWRALFTCARNRYKQIYWYDKSRKFKAKLDGDCNLGKANVYSVLKQVLGE